jgi:hypothetical protein
MTRVEMHTGRVEMNLLRNGLYFEHNFFIWTLIWVIQNPLKK